MTYGCCNGKILQTVQVTGKKCDKQNYKKYIHFRLAYASYINFRPRFVLKDIFHTIFSLHFPSFWARAQIHFQAPIGTRPNTREVLIVDDRSWIKSCTYK